MPDRDRGLFFKAVTAFFVATVGVLTGLAIWDCAALYTQHRLEAQHYTAEYASESQESIEQCAALATGADIAECVSQVVTASREHQRGERDLRAQRDMAEWTGWLLVASGAGIWITLAGVIYVALTLQATRDAVAAANRTADEAKRIGEAQVRAYPSVVSVRIGGITNGLPGITVNVKNSGSSPALRMKCWGRLMLTYQEDALPQEALPDGAVVQRNMVISVISHSQVYIAPNSEGDVNIFANHTDDIERTSAMREMASNIPRRNPFWNVSIFFDWVDVFGVEYNFYINADQHYSHRRKGVAGKLGAMDELVLTDPFEISFQSESRERNSGE